MSNGSIIYEVTKAHHFIQKLKVLINNAQLKQHEATEAVEELEKGINEIIKQLKEINDE